MTREVTTELFFRPAVIREIDSNIPAKLYNSCRLLLSRCQDKHLFIPIRSMQYLAVLDSDEVIFVDSMAYEVRGNEGGRVIKISWQFSAARHRESLSAPVPVVVLHHHQDIDSDAARLVQEFHRALELFERQRYLNKDEMKVKRVIQLSDS